MDLPKPHGLAALRRVTKGVLRRASYEGHVTKGLLRRACYGGRVAKGVLRRAPFTLGITL